MNETEHLWALLDAWQIGSDGHLLELRWECENCGKEWATLSPVTMPNWESGECEE